MRACVCVLFCAKLLQSCPTFCNRVDWSLPGTSVHWIPQARILEWVVINISQTHIYGVSGASDDKESACNAGELGLIPESGRSPGEGNGDPIQYSCLENSMDIRAWQAIFYGVAKSQTQLSKQYFHTFTHTYI